ncbi:MAG: SPOR domain-containing protein [Flavobacteriaceae bacterium]|nr:SPOR domain-containing protein [Flavobacteriaceae bacterium]
MTIFKDIVELLHNNDCVILPGFGAFVLKKKSASIIQNKFIPPSKNVSFNSMLKENDGLLVKYISGTRKTSYKKALNLVEKEVEAFNKKLTRDLLVEIESIGVFELKDENSLNFNPDLSINFDSSSFGLQSFLKDPLLKNIKTESKKEISFVSNYLLRNAAIFISVMGLSYLGYFNYTNYIDTEKLNNIAVAQNQILKKVQAATFDLGELPAISLNVSAPVINQSSIYFSVIAGSFRSKNNAQKQLNSLISLGYKASYTTINPKGLFRVAYARLKTRKEASSLISKIKGSGQDAWLLIEN